MEAPTPDRPPRKKRAPPSPAKADVAAMEDAAPAGRDDAEDEYDEHDGYIMLIQQRSGDAMIPA